MLLIIRNSGKLLNLGDKGGPKEKIVLVEKEQVIVEDKELAQT